MIVQSGVFAQVAVDAAPPVGGEVDDVIVQLLLFPAAWSGPGDWEIFGAAAGTYQTAFDPLFDAQRPDCYMQVSPQSAGFPEQPALDIETGARFSLRFSEPMDPLSLTAFDSLTLTRNPIPELTNLPTSDYVVGRVDQTADLRSVTFVPDQLLAHQQGSSENYYLTLADVDDAFPPRDLAGNVVASLPNVELSIEGSIGPHRRWTWTRATLDDIKTIRTALGGTVNDVVLAAITHGYRELLLHRGDSVDGVVLRTLVPVSVRGTGDHSFNNQVSAMIAELPVGVDGPLERLAAVCHQMSELKESHQADAGGIVAELAEFAPPALLAGGLRTAVSVLRRVPQRSVNTVTTNVPGPQFPLYACGREMLDYLPFVPLSYGVRTGVAILSYNGKVAFGLTGDYDTVPDLDVLAAGIDGALDELLALSRTSPRAR